MVLSIGIGEKLRKARLEKGITYDDVVKDTKIRARYLQALEEEEWDVFPGKVYLKGFLRTYSNYLGLNDAEFIEQIKEIATKEPEIINIPQRIEMPGRPRRKMGIVYGVIAVLLLLVFQYTYTHYLSKPNSLIPQTPTVQNNETQNNIPKDQAEDPNSLPAEGNSPETDQDKTDDKLIKSINLKLQAVQGRCWVQVKNGNAVIYEGTMREGDEKVFPDLQTVDFTLGNSGGVRYFLNDTDYGIPGKTGDVVYKRYALQDNRIVELSM